MNHASHPEHTGPACEEHKTRVYIYIYIIIHQHHVFFTEWYCPSTSSPSWFFRVKCNVPTSTLSSDQGTEYKTDAELYDLQNPQPATKEFLAKLSRFHIYMLSSHCMWNDQLSHGSARWGWRRKVGRCTSRELSAKLCLAHDLQGWPGRLTCAGWKLLWQVSYERNSWCHRCI